MAVIGLTTAIETVISDSNIINKASAISKLIQKENGVAKAVEVITYQ